MNFCHGPTKFAKSSKLINWCNKQFLISDSTFRTYRWARVLSWMLGWRWTACRCNSPSQKLELWWRGAYWSSPPQSSRSPNLCRPGGSRSQLWSVHGTRIRTTAEWSGHSRCKSTISCFLSSRTPRWARKLLPEHLEAAGNKLIPCVQHTEVSCGDAKLLLPTWGKWASVTLTQTGNQEIKNSVSVRLYVLSRSVLDFRTRRVDFEAKLHILPPGADKEYAPL